MPGVSNVTQLLQAIESGEPRASDQLLPLVYEELRKLVAAEVTRRTAGADGFQHAQAPDLSAASALRVDTVAHANGQTTISFTAAARRTYSVEWKANPDGGGWHKLANIVAQADDHLESVTDARGGEHSRRAL